MRPALRLALLVAVAASAFGCRFKGYEGFANASASKPESYDYASGRNNTLHDPYGDNGNADATGGLGAPSRYGQGANPDGTPLPGYDQPQKGSGQERNEYPNVASAGHAQTNAPSFQPSPSDVGGPR